MSEELTVIARNSEEMLAAQGQLTSWAANQVSEAAKELELFQENFDIAKRNKWRTVGLQAALNVARKKYQFYEKMKVAVESGYVIVPNFPIDVFAIRTTRELPKEGATSNRWDSHIQRSELPALGEGEYVSDRPTQSEESWTEKDKEGHDITKWRFTASEFRDVDFPIRAVKPQIMDEVGKAMALRVFDEIGILPARKAKSDPMVVGQIVFRKGGNERRLSFLITWWLSESHLLV